MPRILPAMARTALSCLLAGVSIASLSGCARTAASEPASATPAPAKPAKPIVLQIDVHVIDAATRSPLEDAIVSSRAGWPSSDSHSKTDSRGNAVIYVVTNEGGAFGGPSITVALHGYHWQNKSLPRGDHLALFSDQGQRATLTVELAAKSAGPGFR